MIIIVSIVLTTQMGMAQTDPKPPRNCIERVNLCEKTLDIASRLIKQQSKQLYEQINVIEKLDHENMELLKLNESLNSERSAWYKNPFILFGLGALTGGIVIGLQK